ncbi:hypothetical protein EAH77_07440 [Ewingella americana]|uniref:Uncharacterized protein n=1 Tax=Ewingella americana TaxID=41202 RepID=A0A502GMJ6_9GAMM|nr:hypothetical protein EAH77_07440 [Ewingella americana]
MHSVGPLWFNERHLWSVPASNPSVPRLFCHLASGWSDVLGRFQGTCYSMNSGLASAGFKQKGHR